MQKSNTPSGKNNEPIWFTETTSSKTIAHNEDTYQTIKTNKVSAEKNTTEVYLGTSPHKIMVCTPCHSDVSMHYCQACLLYTSPSPRDGLLSRMPSSA